MKQIEFNQIFRPAIYEAIKVEIISLRKCDDQMKTLTLIRGENWFQVYIRWYQQLKHFKAKKPELNIFPEDTTTGWTKLVRVRFHQKNKYKNNEDLFLVEHRLELDIST